MKTKLAVTAILCTMLAGPALADDRHHPPQAQGSAMPVERMQQNLRSMEQQLDRIAKAKTDAERQTLMAEHMASMRAQIAMAAGGKAMADCPMMGAGMGGNMGGDMGGNMGGDMGQRMHQMEQRMDMMQMMMQGMMGKAGERMPMGPAK